MTGVPALVTIEYVEAYLSLGWEIRGERTDDWGRPAMLMEWNLDDEPQKPEGMTHAENVLDWSNDEQAVFQSCGI